MCNHKGWQHLPAADPLCLVANLLFQHALLLLTTAGGRQECSECAARLDGMVIITTVSFTGSFMIDSNVIVSTKTVIPIY